MTPTASAATVVFLTGKDLDTAGDSDVALARAMTEFVHVLWVDPSGSPGLRRVSPRLSRVGIRPAASRFPALRRIVDRRRRDGAIAAALSASGNPEVGVVLADPLGRFPTSVPGHRFFYITDDWVSGAPSAGRSRKAVRAAIEANCAHADTVAAVSHTLALRLHLYSKTMDAVRVVPAGCTIPMTRPATEIGLPRPAPIALVGGLDERLDYDILDAVAATNLDIVVIGHHTDVGESVAGRIETFLANPNVHQREVRPGAALSDYLPTSGVGIAPFTVDAFNRAGFPTHALDYLASGLPVVTTDLPATRWLDCEHVAVAHSPDEFVRYVTDAVANGTEAPSASARREAAAAHTWTARATTVLRLMALYRRSSAVPQSFAPLRQQPPA